MSNLDSMSTQNSHYNFMGQDASSKQESQVFGSQSNKFQIGGLYKQSEASENNPLVQTRSYYDQKWGEARQKE